MPAWSASQYRSAAARHRTILVFAIPAVLFTLVLAISAYSAQNTSYNILPESWSSPGDYESVISTSPSTSSSDGSSGRREKTTDVWRETRYVGGVAGMTLWENVYLHKGAFHILTSQAEDDMPQPGFVMCAYPNQENNERPPAGRDRWRYVNRIEARELMGEEAVALPGNSILFNDESSPGMSSFLGHYYHFAEVFLAAWRVTTSMYGVAEAELPQRIIFRVEPSEYQDHAGLVNWLHEALLPSTSIEAGEEWRARAESGKTYFFEHLVIVDRFAAHNYGGPEINRWMEMTMGLLDLKVAKHWFDPLRDRLMRDVIEKGCDMRSRHGGVPVVTYLNRQKTGRRLTDDDAKALELELDKLAADGQIELHNAYFEDMPQEEQFCLVLRTDVMLGVHGNGLTHQVWMKHNSAVIEIMGEGGFAITFPWLAKIMGHEHYSIHNDHVFQEEDWVQDDGRPLGQDGLFRTDRIRASAPFVVGLVKKLAEARDSRQPE